MTTLSKKVIPGIDKIALTIPLKNQTIEQFSQTIEDLYTDKSIDLRPINKPLRMYNSACQASFGKKKQVTVRIDYNPRPNFNIRPIRIEVNPNLLTSKNTPKMINFLRRLLMNDYPLLLAESRVTKLDLNFDFMGIHSDQIQIFTDHPADTRTLCSKGQVIMSKVEDKKHGLVVTVYDKSDPEQRRARLEFRFKFPKANKGQSELLLRDLHRFEPQLIDFGVISSDFYYDDRFDPGFQDSVKRRGLKGALTHYRSRNPSLAKKYEKKLIKRYSLNVIDTRIARQAFVEAMSFRDIFTP